MAKILFLDRFHLSLQSFGLGALQRAGLLRVRADRHPELALRGGVGLGHGHGGPRPTHNFLYKEIKKILF